MIDIKYHGGEMLIEPRSYFRSRNATAGKFRKLARLSAESDLIYGTKAIEAWIEAVNEELRMLNDEIEAKKDTYDSSKSGLRKRLESRKRKFEKFRGIAENTTVLHAAAQKWTEVIRMKLYAIKNKLSGTFLRDNYGDIRIFQSEIAALNYIAEHLSDRFWDVASFRR